MAEIKCPSLLRSEDLHTAMRLYHTTRPVIPWPAINADDFKEIGRDVGHGSDAVYAKHETLTLYRVTPLLKYGKRGLSKYYAYRGAPCPNAEKARRWRARVEAEQKEQMALFEAAVKEAADRARRDGEDVEAEIAAAHLTFRKMYPGFGIVT